MKESGFFDFFPTVCWTFVFFLVFWGLAMVFSEKLKYAPEKKKRILWGLLIAAAAIRLAYPWIAGDSAAFLSDEYYLRAASLYAGKGLAGSTGYPTALFMPGYTLLLALVFYLSGGPTLHGAYLLQTLLGFLGMGIVYLLGRALLNEEAGLMAAVIFGFFPSQIVMATFAQSDLLFEVSLYCGVAFLALGKFASRRSLKIFSFLFSGLFFGAASLTRPYGLFLFVIYGIYLFFILPREAGWIALLFLTVFLLQSGWVIRNARLFHAFVPMTTGGGLNLWEANHPGASGKFDWLPAGAYTLRTPEEEMALDHRMGKEALAYIRKNPLLFLKKIPKKWAFLIGNDATLAGDILERLKVKSHLLRNVIGGFTNGYYLAFFFMAFWFCARRIRFLLQDPIGSFGMVLFATLLGVFVVFHAESRFHMPIIPALCIYAAGFLGEGLL